MLELNKDVIFLILEELKNDRKSLYSCLLINKTWCEMTVPILWKIPGLNYLNYNNNKKIRLLNVILLHLSEESRNILKDQGIKFFTTTKYQRPFFNYINFWRSLNLHLIEEILNVSIEQSKISIVRNEILKLFINKNTKFIELYIPQKFNYQIHLISGVENCFSELEYLCCDANIDQNILRGLSKIIKSIKKLRFKDIMQYNDRNKNIGIISLIETQENLEDICFNCYSNVRDESYCVSLEESLIKKANILEILRTQQVPSKILANLIENTKGYLTEISICYEGVDNKRLIQAIYENCPNLKYLKLSFINNDITELEKLLIKCKHLSGLVIIIFENEPDWDNLFKVLISSSPINLFKFKFSSFKTLKLETLKFFFDNWKDRHPILLQTNSLYSLYSANTERQQQINNLVETYKKKGIVKTYDVYWQIHTIEDFEWEKTF
ncbi:11130_t:CDS:2 [Rhizophagus irregularis]|nr:11130_t:CDS:2 [Rhizophagus irregularis]